MVGGRALRGLCYMGGKTRAGGWVAEQLPYRTGYVEPFAGMLGVLLQRRPSRSEIVNDVNSRITNWWTVVRDHGTRLARLLELTPISRDEWDRALEQVDTHPDPVERARMFTVLVQQSITHVPNPAPSDFVLSYCDKAQGPKFLSRKVAQLQERLSDLQIENIDANRLLEKTVNKTDIVIYCDPPYAGTRSYTDNDRVDRETLAELLAAQKGAVAISGYGDEWDHLGWRKTSRTYFSMIGTHAKSETYHTPTDFDITRIESLWANYPAPAGTLF